MNKERTNRKKKEIREVPDLDIVAAFLHKKVPNARSNHLHVTKTPRGSFILHWRRTSKHHWEKLADLGYVESMGQKRYLLIINPAFGDSFILKSLFGGFDNSNIVYTKGLLPINITQALEVNNNYFLQNYANDPIFESIEP